MSVESEIEKCLPYDGRYFALKSIFNTGVNPNIVVTWNEPAPILSIMADFNDMSSVALLLRKGADPNIDDGKPLLNAAFSGNYEIVKLLVDNGADINHLNKEDRSILMSLADHWKLDVEDMIPFLVELGADLHLKNKQGQTALDLAKAAGNRGSVKKAAEILEDIIKKEDSRKVKVQPSSPLKPASPRQSPSSPHR